MKKCSACGEVNTPDAAFCSNCGQSLQQSENRKKCPSCGTANEPDAAFCSNCGRRMDTGAPAADQSPVAEELLALNS